MEDKIKYKENKALVIHEYSKLCFFTWILILQIKLLIYFFQAFNTYIK